jgi:hypothetical protein
MFKKIAIPQVALLLIGLLIVFLYPVTRTYDQEAILNSYKYGVITDWHSVVYQYVAVGLNSLNENTQAKLQIVIYFCSLALLIDAKKQNLIRLNYVFFAVLCVSPLVVATIAQEGKDGFVFSLLAIITALLLTRRYENKFWFAALVVAIALMISVREIYILIIAPAIFYLIKLSKFKFSVLLAAAVIGIGSQYIIAYEKVEKSYMTQYLFVSDIVGVAIIADEDLIISQLSEKNHECKKINSLEIIRKLKNQNMVNPGGVWNVDPIFLSSEGLCLTKSEGVYREIRNLWLHTLINYPLEYIQHRVAGQLQFFIRDLNFKNILIMIIFSPFCILIWTPLLFLRESDEINRALVLGGMLYVVGFLFFGIGYDARYLLCINILIGMSLIVHSQREF